MRSYANAASFRRALEDRLRDVARQRGVQIQGLRLKVAIERLLARLFDGDDPPWLLKGGYAMELRFRPKARTTRDLDLTMNTAVDPQDLSRRLDETHEAMQIAASVDLHDSFEFLVQPARKGIQGAPGGGGVYGVVARMAGKDFARFHIDVGFGDAVPRDVETLVGDDLMGFARITPASVRAIPRAQQFAEKVHAYTVPWTDRENTRSRDLVDLLLLIERGNLDTTAVRRALSDTFEHRAKQPLPVELPEPPSGWREEFPAMAEEAALSTVDLRTAFDLVATHWRLLWSRDATQPD